MALRILPFGALQGFSDLGIAGTSYYSQGMSPSLFGGATLYSIVNKIDSSTVSTMGNIKCYALGPGGFTYAQDTAGHILKEATPGAYDFTIVHSPGGNGAGLFGDQYGNLLYACGTTNNQLGLYDGSSWNDTYQSLISWQHPMSAYEDLRVIGNKNAVACIFSDATWNNAAFTLPSFMTIDAISGGPTGILMGANYGNRGAIILWDGNSPRSKYPWKWTNGTILSIAPFGENWIVETQREVLITNGVTVKQLFHVFDDPLSMRSFSVGNDADLTQRMLVINDTLIFAVPRQISGPTSYEYGKMKPGLYLYSLSHHAWNYLPVATGNTITADVYSIFSDAARNRILIGYQDATTAVNYIATISNAPATRAMWVSEPLGIGRVHYQRVFFGPTDKVAEAVVLNLGILNSITDPATNTFNVALKLYDFKRQLWGKQMTNASITGNNKLQVDGTSSSYSKAQAGDEVTVLNGTNAGQIAHIASIANAGTNTETWTLDTTLTNQTANNISLNVQPFKLVEKKTFTNLSQLKRIFFSVKDSNRASQFLVKVVLDGLGTNLQLELQTSYFVFDDLGYDQT
jgi:hypothetical protein